MITRALLPALLLAMGFGMPADTGAAGGPDRFISQDEFSVLFEPDPEETMKKRGLAKVPRPGYDAKKREATTYVLFETGAILLKSPEYLASGLMRHLAIDDLAGVVVMQFSI